MVLVQKWPFLHLFSDNLGQDNVFYNILELKNVFQGNKNKNLKNSKNWNFSERVSRWFLSRIGHFLISCFLDNLGHENVFYDILERKNTFAGYEKKRSSKSRKIEIFPNWVVHGFGLKLAFFSSFFFFGQSRLRKCVLWYSSLKTRSLKRWKNWELCKEVSPWFWSKIGHFSFFFQVI